MIARMRRRVMASTHSGTEKRQTPEPSPGRGKEGIGDRREDGRRPGLAEAARLFPALHDLPVAAHRGRTAGRLRVENRARIKLFVRRREFRCDLVEADLEFFGEQQWRR